jgi:hypothetical protein
VRLCRAFAALDPEHLTDDGHAAAAASGRARNSTLREAIIWQRSWTLRWIAFSAARRSQAAT